MLYSHARRMTSPISGAALRAHWSELTPGLMLRGLSVPSYRYLLDR